MMKTSLLLLALWTGSTQHASAGDCKSELAQHHVILSIPGDDEGHCTGALIRDSWVLSAAQCDESDLEVILGQSSSMSGVRRKVKKKVIFKNQQQAHDIMLLEVEKMSSDKFAIASLPDITSCNRPANNAAVHYVGWTGLTINFKDNTADPQTQRCGATTVTDCGDKSRYDKNPEAEMKAYSYQTLFCATHPENACDFLSGGALIAGGLLHGVLVNSDISCEAPLEYMDICHREYRQWIRDTAGV